MRTTLDIDDDVLAAAKQLARQQNSTAGRVISELARRAMTTSLTPDEGAIYRNGFRLLPRTGKIITSDMVKKWLEEDG